MPQLGPENKLGFNNPICWLLGHNGSGEWIEKSRRSVAGEITGGWQYYCKRCQDPKNFPINQYPDRRNLYQRTVRVWIQRQRNRWKFRNFGRYSERERKRDLLYLDEQLKKYSTKE